MESVNRARETATAVAVFSVTTLLVWFGNGLTPWWPLMWLAPLPLFWFSLRSSWWSAALVAACGWLAGSASLLVYFRLLGMPFFVWLANFGGAALMVATGMLLFRGLVLRRAMWTGMVALPALWVSVDWLRNWTTPHGTSADLAYTQLGFLPFLQLAAVTGPWEATLLVEVSVAHQSTLFQKWGDWFAWVAVGVFAIVIARRVGFALRQAPGISSDLAV